MYDDDDMTPRERLSKLERQYRDLACKHYADLTTDETAHMAILRQEMLDQWEAIRQERAYAAWGRG